MEACFIRNCDRDLQEELKKMGYSGEVGDYKEGTGLVAIASETYSIFAGVNIELFTLKVDRGYSYVDCKEDKHYFLALAKTHLQENPPKP